MKIDELKCIYDNETKATKLCDKCGSPLCSICGYIGEMGEDLCNTCYMEDLPL